MSGVKPRRYFNPPILTQTDAVRSGRKSGGQNGKIAGPVALELRR
jgi:hypothetical protein